MNVDDITASLLSAVLGAVVGAAAAYYPAAIIARRQARVEHGRDFVSSNYLPLLAAISQYKFALAAWAHAKNDNDPSQVAIHELGYVRSVEFLRAAVARVFESGVPLVLLRIDPLLHGFLMAVHARFQTTVRTDVTEIEQVGLNPEVIMELEDRLEALAIPRVVFEYERLMSDDNKTPPAQSILDRTSRSGSRQRKSSIATPSHAELRDSGAQCDRRRSATAKPSAGISSSAEALDESTDGRPSDQHSR